MSDTGPDGCREVPRYFGIMAEIHDRPDVLAWGYELAGQAVTSWHLATGAVEVAVFASAEAALEVAESMCPASLIWLRMSLPGAASHAKRPSTTSPPASHRDCPCRFMAGRGCLSTRGARRSVASRGMSSSRSRRSFTHAQCSAT